MSRYASLLTKVERPSRYLGNELGLPHPVPPHRARLRVVLGFPDIYEVGMSHLGFRLLHAGLACRPELNVERVFLPWIDLQAQLQQQRLPLSTLESFTPVVDFDLLGLSVQYELAFPAVLRLLDLAGLPRRTEERAAAPGGGRWPLVLVGGSAALNPEPLAPFVDAFFLGEADLALHEIVDCLAEHRDRPLQEKLALLACLEGVYVPRLVKVEHEPSSLGLRVSARPPARLPVRRRYIEDLDRLPVPSVHLVPVCNLIHDRVTIEIQRGCSQGCRFCQAGYVSRPTRQRDPELVLEAARRLLRGTGYQALALLSLSAGDYGCLQPLLAALIEEHGPKQVAVSLPSLRTEGLQPQVARQISGLGKTTFTLAPEAASERLRRVINKQNTDEDLLRAAEGVARAGFGQIKLYFMIGLPGETDEDVRAIARLARQVLQRVRTIRSSTSLVVSVSTFVPKPHTALQWEPAPHPDHVRRKLSLLQGQIPRRIRLRWHDPGQSFLEACLARADRRMASVLERGVTDRHHGLDAWTDLFDLQHWERALNEAHRAQEIPSPELYLGPRDPDQALPWDHLDVGVERAYLLQERQAALQAMVRPDCTDGTCDSCGVCPGEPLHRLVRPVALSPARPDPNGPAAPAGEPAGRPGHRERPWFLRLWFHKTGQARFISHLEMVGLFERAARRACFPLAFSGGLHPRPRLRFSPALPLGAESLCELLELGLSSPGSPAELGQRLAGQLPPGIEIQSAEEVKSSLLNRIRGIRWRLLFHVPLPSSVLQAARQLLQTDNPLPCCGKERVRDLREWVLDLEPTPDGRGVDVRCLFDRRGTVRPREILEILLAQEEPEQMSVQVIRLAWDLDG